MKTATMTAPAATADARTSMHVYDMPSSGDDDDFDDIINDGYRDDDGRPHDETCEYAFAECPQRARFWLKNLQERQDGTYKEIKQFYCPRHFALRLHEIIDANATSHLYESLGTPAQRRDLMHLFYESWGRTGI
ncbi:hypothetical protein [Bifidobacterium jacchi]|uniref:Uncharacterized protein n=1 Tax=Bifidobacterium jacchi TaxID=2490545 RepID=A0A5N5RJC2_9BIFI|nr:hypothetical protein [Bifidobacterium jacchi]KAB5607388.1 hypothetical protein EHS19_04880 [Bifidobacterium jacchi]